MNIDDLHILLYQPTSIGSNDTSQLKQVLKDYPYFQAARSLYLKSLYSQNNHRYNSELKKTAVYTLDRDILFDFITSKDFVAYKPFEIDYTTPTTDQAEVKVAQLSIEEQLQDRFAKIVYSVKSTPSLEEPAIENHVANKIQDETPTSEILSETPSKDENLISELQPNSAVTDSAVEEENIVSEQTSQKDLEEKLQIGEPLQFSSEDKFSFNEWLQLSQKQTIHRENKEAKTETVDTKEQEDSAPKTEKLILTEQQLEQKATKQKKTALIDKFILTNPKIVPTKKLSSLPVNIEVSIKENDSLMTETLAKIYLEQKKYQKAIQAYEILILKYPEKSIFFADQILDIKALQQHNS